MAKCNPTSLRSGCTDPASVWDAEHARERRGA